MGKELVEHNVFEKGLEMCAVNVFTDIFIPDQTSIDVVDNGGRMVGDIGEVDRWKRGVG